MSDFVCREDPARGLSSSLCRIVLPLGLLAIASLHAVPAIGQDVRPGPQLEPRLVVQRGASSSLYGTAFSRVDAAFSPDGRLLAVAAERDTGVVGVYDAESGRLVARLVGDPRRPSDLAFGHDGATLHVVRTPYVEAWDLAARSVRGRPSSTNMPRTVATTPGGRRLVTGGENGELSIIADGHEQHTVRVADAGEVRVATIDDRTAAWAAERERLGIVDLESGESELLRDLPDARIVALGVHDGQVIAVTDRALRIWHAETRAPVTTHALPDAATIDSASVSGPHVAVLANGELWHIDLSRRQPETQSVVPFDLSSPESVAVSPTGQIAVLTRQSHLAVYMPTPAGYARHFESPPSMAMNFRDVEASRDGRWIAAVDADGLALWDMHRLEVELLTSMDPTVDVPQLSMTPDGMRLGVTHRQSVTVYALPEREEIATIGPRWWVDVAVSPDGGTVAAITMDRRDAVLLFDVETGEEVAALTSAGSPADGKDGSFELVEGDESTRVDPTIDRELDQIEYSPDGRWIGAVHSSGDVTIFDVETGDPRHRFGSRADAGRRALAFDPHGRWVAVHRPERGLDLMDLETGGLIRTIDAPADDLNGLTPSELAISPDGRWLAADDLDTIWLWDLTLNARVDSVGQHPGGGALQAIQFTGDGDRVLAVTRDDPSMSMWEVGELIARSGRRLGSDSEAAVRDVAFSPDSELVAFAREAQIHLHRVESDVRLMELDSPSGLPISRVTFTPDGEHLLAGDAHHEVHAWRVEGGRLVARTRLSELDVPIRRLVALPDGTVLATPHPEFVRGRCALQIRLEPAGWGQNMQLTTLDTSLCLNEATGAADLAEIELDPTGTVLGLAGGAGMGLELRDLEADFTPRLHLKEASGETLALGPRAEVYAAATDEGLTLHRGADGSQIASIEQRGAEAATVSPDGKLLAYTPFVGGVRLWSIESRRDLPWRGALESALGHSTPLAFSPDGNWLAAGAEDGTLRLWEMTDDAVRSRSDRRVVLGRRGDAWFAATDRGVFAGSNDGQSMVATALGTRSFALDQFALANNRPDEILSRLGSPEDDLIAHYRQLHHRRVGRFRQRLADAGFDPKDIVVGSADGRLTIPTARIVALRQEGRDVELDIVLESSGTAPLALYQIYVDEVPLYPGFGAALPGGADDGARAELTERVQLIPGTNKIEVAVLDAGGNESWRGVRYATWNPSERAAPRGDLWVVALGVSDYSDDRLDLGYASKDAQDLVKLLDAARESGRFAEVHTLALTDDELVREAIPRVRALLERTEVDDTVVLQIAGHGMHDADRRYYFLSHETDLDDLPSTAISFGEIEALLAGIPARRKLFLMDTCESGELEAMGLGGVLEDARDRGITPRARLLSAASAPAADDAVHSLDIDRSVLLERDRFIHNDIARRTGAIVISSSRGAEFSYESDALENGFFTEAVLRALTTDGETADANGDGVIDDQELRGYVAGVVSELSEGFQNPAVDRDNLRMRVGLPVLADLDPERLADAPLPEMEMLPEATARPPGELAGEGGGCACASVRGVGATAARERSRATATERGWPRTLIMGGLVLVGFAGARRRLASAGENSV